jgi:hypothetical protein
VTTITIDPDRVTLFGQVLTRPPYVPVGEWQDIWTEARPILEQTDSEKDDQIENLEKELAKAEKDIADLTTENEGLDEVVRAVKKAVRA